MDDLRVSQLSGRPIWSTKVIGDLAFDGSAGKAHCRTSARRLPTVKEQALVVTLDSLFISAWGGTLAVAALVACGL
jgi:hypothetical protein